ncbi:MAG: hypothetical protein ACI9V1_000357 [Spirosomataceae bacterium]|jgi:hypothetical protein
MSKFDFKKYHVRAMNASNEAEKAAINQELKDFYDTLNATDKEAFNAELQGFLVSEYSKIKSVCDGVKGGDNPN